MRHLLQVAPGSRSIVVKHRVTRETLLGGYAVRQVLRRAERQTVASIARNGA
jgi:hypothetical protein